MIEIPAAAYVSGLLFVSAYCSLFLFSAKIEKKLFSSKPAKKIRIFSIRLANACVSGIKKFRDVFLVRLVEEGIIEGLLLDGTARLFSAAGNTPLRKLDGNINWYMALSVASITVFLLFL